MSDDTIRTGIIGYGLSGRIFHSPFIATSPRFSLEVVSTGDAGRRAQLTGAHPEVAVVDTPGELLARAGELDLVVLASPVTAHVEQGVVALEAGAAIVIDKPFAPTVADAERLIAASERASRPIFVYQNRRWDGDFLTVRRLLAAGELGAVHRFESTFERWSPTLRDRWQDTDTTAQGAGITFDLGSHVVDQALQLFGPATLETAEMSIVRPGGVTEDEAFLSLRHASGVRSHLMISRMAGQNAPRFRVLGDRAAYAVYGVDPQEPQLVAGVSPLDEGYGVEPEARWGRLGVGDALTAVPTERGDYPAFYAGVAAALRDGGPLPVDPRDALAALRVIQEAHELTGL